MKKVMMMKSFGFAAFVAAFALVLFAVGSVGAYAAKGDLVPFGEAATLQDNILEVPWGKARLIDLDDRVADVLVANPGLVSVVAVKSNQLYVVGKDFGDTNILILDGAGDVLRDINVHVRYDVAMIQSYVDKMFPDEDVTISMLHDQMVLTGVVSTPDVANKVISLVGHYFGDLIDVDGEFEKYVYNMLTVRGEQQVMLRVRIMEVSRDILKEIGPESLSVTDFGGFLGDDIAAGFARSVAGGSGGGVSEPSFGELTLVSSKGAFGPVNAVFDALEEDGLANLLAEPNLTAISGEQAGFLAGGEFPVPSGIDSNGNVVVSFRSFGVALNFVPRVLSEDRIVLQMNTEVSSLNRNESVTLSGVEVPGIDIRRASTTVEVGSGSSLMIAGLLQSETVKSLASLPGVMDTPILGDLMTSDNFIREESELVVIVTPLVVKPYAGDAKVDKKSPPAYVPNPLAQAFSSNIKRRFDMKDEEIWGADEVYGYLLD